MSNKVLGIGLVITVSAIWFTVVTETTVTDLGWGLLTLAFTVFGIWGGIRLIKTK